jgi:hypothetical protein
MKEIVTLALSNIPVSFGHDGRIYLDGGDDDC